ncbi:MAG TPA: 4Fe-4S dicluster domain-containing protein [Anaeromyxobacteraceae bacterium]|nr:4Fe-4S dicluster domain-containing protein [Anaeromyxobacteraceae bacterium]
MSDRAQGGLPRRTFLKIAGAAGLAAGCSPKAATQKLVPLLVPPEDIVPGVPLYYRTVCRECPAGCGVTARTREGRAVKLEGNPEEPIGRGALCARGQAAVQALYHPDRFRGPMRRGADGGLSPVGWDQAEDQLAQAIAAARARGPGRVRLVTRAEPGAAGDVQRALLAAVGGRPGDRLVLEPLDPAPVRAAGAALFGRPEIPALDLAAAHTVVSFGADFLESWISPVEYTRQFAAGRGRIGDDRTRLVWVGPRLSLTGVSADRWLRVLAGGELPLALGLLRWILDPGNRVAGLAPEVAALAPALLRLSPADLAARAGVAAADVEGLARELARRRPSALLGPGPSSQGPDATALAAVLLLLDLAVGNFGRTMWYGLDPAEEVPSTAAEAAALVEAMAAGQVDVLLAVNADPLAALPAALKAGEAAARVPLLVSFALRPDATAARAHLILPDHHTLESFGDVSPRAGVLNLAQPVMTPLFDTRQAVQVLLEVAGRLQLPAPLAPSADPYDLLQDRAGKRVQQAGAGPGADAAAAWREALQRGGAWSDAAPARRLPQLARGAAGRFLALGPAPAPAAAGEVDLVLFPTALHGDGRSGELPWLQEIPDTLTSVSWSPWAEISPATAGRLGVRSGDLLALAGAAGRAEVPAYVFPGIRDDAVAVRLGSAGARALTPAGLDPASGARAYAGSRVALSAAGRREPLPLLEGSPYQHGREIVQTVTAAAPAARRADLTHQMYPEPRHPDHRWAMAIDLDRCTGCEACVVACFAENNVPVMGAEAARMGRYMGWLRIERYLGDEPGGALDVQLLPMLCQQCTNAPCETVCPVYATYHTPEGLNAQVYNRCVGTRYCSNNCPYKVRTFNWRDPEFKAPLPMQLNPDVTVRSRGVMEKCTFCVQRIRYAEGQARDEGRPVADGEIVPACAQTCPARAIVFGDANDPASRLSRAARAPRGFRALEEVNTQPAITYLARVRRAEEP